MRAHGVEIAESHRAELGVGLYGFGYYALCYSFGAVSWGGRGLEGGRFCNWRLFRLAVHGGRARENQYAHMVLVHGKEYGKARTKCILVGL